MQLNWSIAFVGINPYTPRRMKITCSLFCRSISATIGARGRIFGSVTRTYDSSTDALCTCSHPQPAHGSKYGDSRSHLKTKSSTFLQTLHSRDGEVHNVSFHPLRCQHYIQDFMDGFCAIQADETCPDILFIYGEIFMENHRTNHEKRRRLRWDFGGNAHGGTCF